MRYFLELSYNGKEFHGWQNQPNAITVQSVVDDALSKLLGEHITTVGAGRTDAGVHAKQMFAHFDVKYLININELIFKLNAFLPQTIAVYNIYKVKDSAHARFDALSRAYIYKIDTRKNVFSYDKAYYIKKELNLNLLNSACAVLYEYNDFKCFSKSRSDVKTYLCDITFAKWIIKNDSFIFEIKANRFLRNMVRAIVGTMIEIGLEKTSLNKFHEIISSKDRTKAGASVPAHGLYLNKIEYPKDIFI